MNEEWISNDVTQLQIRWHKSANQHFPEANPQILRELELLDVVLLFCGDSENVWRHGNVVISKFFYWGVFGFCEK